MTLARSEREWAILVSEFNVCKKKLNSKREALKILTSDLELCQRERDIYKTKIKQLLKEAEESKRKEKEREKEDQNKVAKTKTQSPERSQGHKRERRCSGNTLWEQELQHIRERKQKTLSQLLCDSRGENKALQKDLADLRQLYYDAQEDIQLLRESLARQKNSIKIKDGAENSIDPRQDLISQLEKDQEKMSELERDIQALSDEKSEIATERDHFRDKSERLNTQLNFILGADDRRLVDIDSVLMENRYLKEQIKQLKEEKTMAVSSLNRYKNTFEKRKNKILQAQYQGSYSSMAKHAVPSLFSELLGNLSSSTSPSTVADLQLLANSLSETLSEKDTALQHLRSANKILGHRVAELEKKLKTLEVSGLWSLQGHRGYGSTAADKLSKERIYYKGHLLMTEDDAPSNDQHEGDASSEDVGRTSEPDSPASPGSPTLRFSPFQGVVEEGVLVNVAGSPGVVLDELEGVELLDSGSDDEANHFSDNLSPPPAARKSLKEDFAEASQLNERDCSAAREESPQEGAQTDEFCDFTTYGDTKVLLAEESSLKPSPPGLDNHTALSPEQTIGNGTRVSDTELSPFLKRVGSSDEG